MEYKILKTLACMLLLGIILNISSAAALEIAEDNIDIMVQTFEFDDDIIIEETIGLSSYIPFDEEVSIYGVDKPSRSTKWDFSTRGTYTIASSYAYYNTLYTDYNFTGTTKLYVSISVPSSSSWPVTFKLVKNNLLSDKDIAAQVVQPGTTVIVMYSNLSSSGLYYLEFPAPCEFSGEVYA